MVQSWNKFCFQGGMLEVRARLPGAINNSSGNPDLAKGPSARVATGAASTNRTWPFSYNRCDPDVFEPSNQRISACDSNPGYGLTPNQGRGAPEIDLIEGSATLASSSLQIGPGMAGQYRLMSIDYSQDQYYCIYANNCKTPGANSPDVPTGVYMKQRRHKSWYQGLRYQGNPFCEADPTQQQRYEKIAAKVKAGITENACGPDNCPGSRDANADLGLVEGKGDTHWSINYNGTCFPLLNVYQGAYLCDPDNEWWQCAFPKKPTDTKTHVMTWVLAISSNWPLHPDVSTEYVVLQIEWVTGKTGYVRWMLDGHLLFEVPAHSIIEVPRDKSETNPKKIMIEESMYLIMNVAVSASWGAMPPNTYKPCRGDGKDPAVDKICGSFPMYMKIDYIRLYQDLGNDLEPDNYMQIGCDPASHPTKEWINGHIEEYTDGANQAVDVAGGAFCTKDADCTILGVGDLKYARLVTGKCQSKRCVCTDPSSWGGPRCTFVLGEMNVGGTSHHKMEGHGPPFVVAVSVAATVAMLSMAPLWWGKKNERAIEAAASVLIAEREATRLAAAYSDNNRRESPVHMRKPRYNYDQNFV